MDEHDDQDCNITLGLGLKQYGPKRDTSQVFFLDLAIIESSTKKMENGKERSNEDDDEDDDGSKCSMNCGPKKLRLTTDQTTLLEDTFKDHSTLNMAQKQELAEKLSLKTRQVEVWFQNRRARTKLKQNETDCKMLKKMCERLSEENRRLREELLELKKEMKIQLPPPDVAAPPLQRSSRPSCKSVTDKSRGGGCGGGPSEPQR